MKKIDFTLRTLVETIGIAEDTLDSGITEHTDESLAVLRNIYPADRLHELDFIEERLKHSQPNRPRLHAQIIALVYAVLKLSETRSVMDIGSGEGMLLRVLALDKNIERIVGVDQDVSHEKSARALISAASSNAIYKVVLTSQSDDYEKLIRENNVQSITLIEVVEHIDDRDWINQFFDLKPKLLIATTPNRSYNDLYPEGVLLENGLRNPDHKFEFTTSEFQEWADAIGRKFSYQVDLLPIGPGDIRHGSSGLMAIFQKND